MGDSGEFVTILESDPRDNIFTTSKSPRPRISCRAKAATAVRSLEGREPFPAREASAPDRVV
jgi:hypothetical protein